MATSASIVFSLSAREVITYALIKLRVLPAGGTPTAAPADGAMDELNMMLKGWQKYESLWRMTEGSATLVANDSDYTLSPVPHRVISARFDDQATETPLTLMTREEYYDLPLKTNTGIPTSYYVDYQRASAVMYIWPLMKTVDDETINYTFQRKFEDIDSLDNDFDIRQEHLEVVAFHLAARSRCPATRSCPHLIHLGDGAFMHVQRELEPSSFRVVEFADQDFVHGHP